MGGEKSAEYYRKYRKEHPEYRARERTRDSDRVRKPREAQPPKPFAGVDGEGCTLNGVHRYVCLRAGEHFIQDDKGLDSLRLLEFLTKLPEGYTWVGFAFNYDVTMILRTIPWNVLKNLFQKGPAGQQWGIWYKNYHIQCTPGKSFTVDYKLPIDPEDNSKGQYRPEGRTRFHVSDTFSFFQCSFVTALDRWSVGTKETRDRIADGKLRRPVLEHLDQECIDYNYEECILLADMMEQLRDACADLDLRPTRWEGPGYLAQALLRSRGWPKSADYRTTWPREVDEAGRASYYGGWFDAPEIGMIPGPVLQADLSSAYPWAMTKLFCLKHAKWEHRKPRKGEYGLVYASLQCRPPRYPSECPDLPPLPHRDKKGVVSHPLCTRGWYWSFELEQARVGCGQRVERLDGWTVVTTCDCPSPGEFMHGMFEERIRLGKSSKGHALKLALNSCYGKLAQSIGKPVYSNHVVASFITAWVRAEMMRAVHAVSCEQGLKCGSNVTMVATDALFIKGDKWPWPDEGKKLGGWEVEVYPTGMFTVMPGVYFKGQDGSESYTPKSRGMPSAVLNSHLQPLKDAWLAWVRTGCDTFQQSIGEIQVPYQRFIGVKEAIHRGHPGQLGRFVYLGGEQGRKISFTWYNKRSDVTQPFRKTIDTSVRTWPKILRTRGIPEESVPYDRVIPLSENESWKDQKMNDTPEGYPALFEV